jgi:hypothetical protein
MLERQTTRREVQTVSGNSMMTLLVPFGQIRCPAETLNRITEWARWASARASLDAHGRCASAEGRYLSEYPDAGRGVKFEVNLQEVMQIERIVVRLPPKYKSLVVGHFVKRDSPILIAARLAIAKARYGDDLKKSILMVKNNLTR